RQTARGCGLAAPCSISRRSDVRPDSSSGPSRAILARASSTRTAVSLPSSSPTVHATRSAPPTCSISGRPEPAAARPAPPHRDRLGGRAHRPPSADGADTAPRQDRRGQRRELLAQYVGIDLEQRTEAIEGENAVMTAECDPFLYFLKLPAPR